MNQTFYCSHQLLKVVRCLKTTMSSAIVLVALPLLLQSVRATFPPVNNAPPIPSQGVRTMDYGRFYIQDDLQPNQPSNMIKDEGYFAIDEKLDEKFFAPENQSGETGGFRNDNTFDSFYSEDQPYIGPVATPLPDDTYVAQPSVTSKVIPDGGPANVGSSDIWVLTKGPDNQFIRERWIQIPMTQDRVIEVVNADVPSKQYTETIKSFPPVVQPPPIPAVPVNAPVASPPSVRQVWIRAPPPPAQSQKVIQNPPVVVQEIPSAKQYVDLPPPAVKQYLQPQIIKDAQPLPPPPPPPPPSITKKSSSFIVPPPPPPPLKVTDFPPPKQTLVFNPPNSSPVPVDQVVVEKSAPLPQLKHIWVPTSQNTGKFITVPIGAGLDAGKSFPAKGVPLDAPPPPSPVAVSDTWILKQDGPIPRFEQQKSIGSVAPVIQKSSVIVENRPEFQFDSPKNPPLIGKSINAPVPVDIWPAKNPIPQQKVIVSAPPPPPPVALALPPPPSIKSDTIVVDKSAPIAPPPKGIITSVKGLPQLPPPPPPAVATQVIKGKPCPVPVLQAKSPFSANSVPIPAPIPVPAYRTIAVNRQPFGRILRINRYPYGPYYVLSPRAGASLYNYPRLPIAPVIQQTKTGQVVRLVPARSLAVQVPLRQVAVPASPKQFAAPVPRKQIVLPVSNGKSASPVLLYPPVSRIRYAYPWGSYIRSLPVSGKNIFVLPPNNKPAKIQENKSSSSESSSSESSSESKSVEKKSKPKEEKKSSEEEEVAESVGSSIESEEPEPEKALEPIVEEEVEAAASEAEPEETSATILEEPETKDESFVVEESQVKPQLINRGYKEANVNSFDPLTKSFYYSFDQRGISDRKETSDPSGKRVIGSYNYRKPDGIFKNVAYVVDANGSKTHVVSNEPGTVSYQTLNTNYISSASPENTTNKVSDIENFASHENLTEDPHRD